MDRNLLVLDLDETLVHAVGVPLARSADFKADNYYVYRRPWLDQFLAFAQANFALAIWSSAGEPYVDEIVRNVVPDSVDLVFVWGASRVTVQRTLPDHYAKFGPTLGDFHDQKRLAKIRRFGWPLERVLIVDDSPEKCAQNYGNAIYVQPFWGDENDDELPYLAAYLETLSDHSNLRNVEKRNWRSSLAPMKF